MKKKTITYSDSLTGEILGDYDTILVPKSRRRPPCRDPFMMISQVSIKNITKKKNFYNIGPEAIRVLLELYGILDWENNIVIKQIDLAKELEIDPANLCRAIKKLVEFGIIEKGPRVGMASSFRLNPAFGWKGNRNTYNKELDSRMKKLNISVVEN